MADEKNFLETLKQNPDDDTTRLVYADWLEEQDAKEHAEYLRLEAELHRMLPRLAALTQSLDPGWLAAVSRKRKLVMTACSQNIIQAIKLVRETNAFGLKEAKDLVDAVRMGRPQIVLDNVDPTLAESIARKFDQIATVIVESASGPLPQARPAVAQGVAAATPPAGPCALVFHRLTGDKIACIVSIRSATGLGIAEAKAISETTQPLILRQGLAEVDAVNLLSLFDGLAQVTIERQA